MAAIAETTNNAGNSALVPVGEAHLAEIIQEERRFALEQRKAQAYAQSSLVPKEYQGNIGNVLIAMNMAKRLGADTLMVMQNLYVVHGRPGWSSAFLIASFNQSGKYSSIKYRFKGEPKTPEWGCQAYCTELATGEEIQGTWITWEMANKEGWATKNGSKWQTLPEQMFRYRSAAFLVRTTAPEIAMGLQTREELEDWAGQEPPDRQRGNGFRQLDDQLAEGKADVTTYPLISEDQRVALFEAAKQSGRNIAEVIEARGFAIVANITTDRYDEILAVVSEPLDALDETESESGAENASVIDADETPLDPVETLRVNLQAKLEEFPKSRQKDLLAGLPAINQMSEDDLNAFALKLNKAA